MIMLKEFTDKEILYMLKASEKETDFYTKLLSETRDYIKGFEYERSLKTWSKRFRRIRNEALKRGLINE